MTTLSERIKRLERLYPPRAYDPAAFVTTFTPNEETLRGALEGAIVAGLMPMQSAEQIDKLVEEHIMRRN